jgi:hypothetical protein
MFSKRIIEASRDLTDTRKDLEIPGLFIFSLCLCIIMPADYYYFGN